MDYSLYDNILRATIWRHLFLYVVLEALAVVSLIGWIFAYKKATKQLNCEKEKDKAKNIAKQRNRILFLIVGGVLSIPLCGLVGYLQVADMNHDLQNHQYVRVEADYNRNPNFEKRLLDDGVAFISLNGENVKMYLPYGSTVEEFPYSRQYGVICYAEESKVILSFEKKDAEEN